MLAEYDYHCPSCSQLLNSDNTVIFKIEKSSGEKGIIELNPKVGKYSYKCEPNMVFEKGEEMDFFCPACRINLKSERFPNFVKLKLYVSKDVYFDMLFSRVFGDRRTYVITEDMTEKYGDNPEDLI
jgi:hypothetical protein